MNTAAPQSLRPAALPPTSAGNPSPTPSISESAHAWAWQRRGLSKDHKVLMLALAQHALRSHDVWPSLTTLAELLEADRKTVRALLADLERLGLLADTGRRAGRTGQVRVLRILCGAAAVTQSGHKASVSEAKASVYPAQSVQCFIGKSAHELFEFKEEKEKAHASCAAQALELATAQTADFQDFNTLEKQPEPGKPAESAPASAPASAPTPAGAAPRPAAKLAPRQHSRPAPRPAVSPSVAAHYSATASGLPKLPPAQPMPAEAKARLARIRAGCQAAGFASVATTHPPTQHPLH